MIKDGENLNVYQLRLNKVALAVKSIPIGLSTKMPGNLSSSFYYLREMKENRLRKRIAASFPENFRFLEHSGCFPICSRLNSLPLYLIYKIGFSIF